MKNESGFRRLLTRIVDETTPQYQSNDNGPDYIQCPACCGTGRVYREHGKIKHINDVEHDKDCWREELQKHLFGN